MLSALICVAGIQHRPLRWWGTQFFTLIFVTFCFGGVLEALNEWYGLPVLAGTAAAAGILYQGFRRRSRQNRRADSQACVSVTVGATTVQMTGLVDTGNQLTEPLTGRAVSILFTRAGRKAADSRVGDGAGHVPDSISLDRKERMDAKQ